MRQAIASSRASHFARSPRRPNDHLQSHTSLPYDTRPPAYLLTRRAHTTPSDLSAPFQPSAQDPWPTLPPAMCLFSTSTGRVDHPYDDPPPHVSHWTAHPGYHGHSVARLPRSPRSSYREHDIYSESSRSIPERRQLEYGSTYGGGFARTEVRVPSYEERSERVIVRH